jgi:hypothetical protein
MSDDPLGKLFHFVDLADPAKNPSENEARNAAMKACEVLRQVRGRLTISRGAGSGGVVHPLAALFAKYDVRPDRAADSGWCCSCGEAYERGARIVRQYKVGATHYECRSWWAKFDFNGLPRDADDDIPF